MKLNRRNTNKTTLLTTFLVATGMLIAVPLQAQTLRPDASGIPQPAPVTGGGAPLVGTGNNVKVGVAGLTRRGLDKNAVLVVKGNGQSTSYNVGGRDVMIQGTGNNIILRGNVRRLTVVGNANRVSTNVVQQVAVSGSGNAVSYQKGATSDRPSVTQTGTRNQITKRK